MGKTATVQELQTLHCFVLKFEANEDTQRSASSENDKDGLLEESFASGSIVKDDNRSVREVIVNERPLWRIAWVSKLPQEYHQMSFNFGERGSFVERIELTILEIRAGNVIPKLHFFACETDCSQYKQIGFISLEDETVNESYQKMLAVKVNSAATRIILRIQLSEETSTEGCICFSDIRFVGEAIATSQSTKDELDKYECKGGIAIIVSKIKSYKKSAANDRCFNKALELKIAEEYFIELHKSCLKEEQLMNEAARTEDFRLAQQHKLQLEKLDAKLNRVIAPVLECLSDLNDIKFLRKLNSLNANNIESDDNYEGDKENEPLLFNSFGDTSPIEPDHKESAVSKKNVLGATPLDPGYLLNIDTPPNDIYVEDRCPDLPEDERPLPALLNKINRFQENDEPLDPFYLNSTSLNNSLINEKPRSVTYPDGLKDSSKIIQQPTGQGPNAYNLDSARSKCSVSRNDLLAAFKGVELPDDLPEVEDIPEALFIEYKDLIEFMPTLVLRCLLSSHPKLRLFALHKIEILFKSSIASGFKYNLQGKEETVETNLSRLCQIVLISTHDQVPNIFSLGVRLGQMFLSGAKEQKIRLDGSVLEQPFFQILRNILSAISVISNRKKQEALALVIQIASIESLGPDFVVNLLVQKRKSGRATLWKPLLTKISILNEILKCFHLSTNTDSILSFLRDTGAFSHPNAQIRDEAKSLTGLLYKSKGSTVVRYLSLLRKTQMDEYKSMFARIDDKLGREYEFMSAESNEMVSAVSPTTNANEMSTIEKLSLPKSINPLATPKEENLKSHSLSARSNRTAKPDMSHRRSAKNNTGSTTPRLPPIHIKQSSGHPFKIDEKLSARSPESIDFSKHETCSGDNADHSKCQFCDEVSANFADEQNLDLHYWKKCPMLTSCSKCEQIIEISYLNEHLLVECEEKDKHRKCPRCGEAIEKQYFENHARKNRCLRSISKSQGNRCPLCHNNIKPSEQGWKHHLLQQRCPNNPRAR